MFTKCQVVVINEKKVIRYQPSNPKWTKRIFPIKTSKKGQKQTRICLNGENLPEIPDHAIFVLQIFYKGEFMDSGIA